MSTKGTFDAKMGSIKDRNGMDLTEVEDIKSRCQNGMKGKKGAGAGVERVQV